MLLRAVEAVYAEQPQLVQRDASERSLMFRVGRHLAPIIEQTWPGRLWVDVEYNRLPDGLGAWLSKELVGLPDARTLKGVDPSQRRSVYPDLIVHDRRNSSRCHNILVMEAKRSPAPQRAIRFDELKLRAFKEQLGYRHAVYLTLGPDGADYQWIDDVDERSRSAFGGPGTSRAVPLG